MTDPIERLKAANPVPGVVEEPDPHLLQEILMTTTSPARPTGELPSGPEAPDRRSGRRLPAVLAAAAALLVLAGVVGALVIDGDDSPADDEVASPIGDGPATDLVDPAAGGSDVTSCVESFSPETLRDRDYAFDGTVDSVEGPDITFAVNEWFAGGTESTVTLDHQGYAGMLLDPNTALEPGTRALMAGDGSMVWSCGFTQLWSDGTAAEWRQAFAG